MNTASKIVTIANERAMEEFGLFRPKIDPTVHLYDQTRSLHNSLHTKHGGVVGNIVYSESHKAARTDHIVPHIVHNGATFLHLTPKTLANIESVTACNIKLLITLTQLDLLFPILQNQSPDDWESHEFSPLQLELLSKASAAPFKTTLLMDALHPQFAESRRQIYEKLEQCLSKLIFSGVNDSLKTNLTTGAFRIAAIGLVAPDERDEILDRLQASYCDEESKQRAHTEMGHFTDLSYRFQFGGISTCHGGNFTLPPTEQEKFFTSATLLTRDEIAQIPKHDWREMEFYTAVFKELLNRSGRASIQNFTNLEHRHSEIETMFTEWVDSGHWRDLETFNLHMRNAFKHRVEHEALRALDTYQSRFYDRSSKSADLLMELMPMAIASTCHIDLAGLLSVGATGIVLTPILNRVQPKIKHWIEKTLGRTAVAGNRSLVKAVATFEEFERTVKLAEQARKA